MAGFCHIFTNANGVCDGNRTRVSSLQGSGSTIELRTPFKQASETRRQSNSRWPDALKSILYYHTSNQTLRKYYLTNNTFDNSCIFWQAPCMSIELQFKKGSLALRVLLKDEALSELQTIVSKYQSDEEIQPLSAPVINVPAAQFSAVVQTPAFDPELFLKNGWPRIALWRQ